MKTTGNILSAPLYVVYGSLTNKNIPSIRSFPLMKAKNKDGVWHYPADATIAKIPNSMLGKIEEIINRSGEIRHRVVFTEKGLIGSMIEKMEKKIVSISGHVVSLPAAVKSTGKTQAQKSIVKKAVEKVVASVPKSSKITSKNVTVPEGGREFHGRDLEDYVAVQNILNGHSNEFAVIYKRYYDTILFRYNKSFSFKEPELCQDLAMEMFEKVYEKLSQYAPKYTFNAWITKIAQNHLVDYCRKASKHPMVSIDKGFGNMEGDTEITMANTLEDDGSNCPELSFITQERKEALNKALSILEDKVRRMIIMRYFYKASYAEIMAQENVNESQVKIAIHRGKQKLREVFITHPQLMAAVSMEMN